MTVNDQLTTRLLDVSQFVLVAHVLLGTHHKHPELQLVVQGKEDEQIGGVWEGPPEPLLDSVGVDAEAAGQAVLGRPSLFFEPLQHFGEVPRETHSTPVGVLIAGAPIPYSLGPRVFTSLENRMFMLSGTNCASRIRCGITKSQYRELHRSDIDYVPLRIDDLNFDGDFILSWSGTGPGSRGPALRSSPEAAITS